MSIHHVHGYIQISLPQSMCQMHYKASDLLHGSEVSGKRTVDGGGVSRPAAGGAGASGGSPTKCSCEAETSRRPGRTPRGVTSDAVAHSVTCRQKCRLSTHTVHAAGCSNHRGDVQAAGNGAARCDERCSGAQRDLQNVRSQEVHPPASSCEAKEDTFRRPGMT